MHFKTGLSVLVSALLVTGLYFPANAAGSRGFAPLKLDNHLVKWGRNEPGTPARVTYAFVQGPTAQEDARNCRSMDSLDRLARISGLAVEDIRAQAAAAFRLWQDVSNLSFEETAKTEEADIVLGVQSIPRGYAFTNVRYRTAIAELGEDMAVEDRGLNRSTPETGNPAAVTGALKIAEITQSAICLNPAHKWKIGFDGDLASYDLRYTFAHEIGHAIGLDHYLKQRSIMHFKYTEEFRDLQPSDIEGVQWLYGTRIN
jgi:predicted Zn-dependent protease